MSPNEAFGFTIAVPSALAIFWRRQLWRMFLATRARNFVDQDAPLPTDPIAFERFCAKILEDRGWRARLTVATGDQGVDVLAKKGRITLAIQCKLYSQPVGNSAVQQIIAGRDFTNATHAAVVSNQPYTASARDLASRTGVALLAPADLIRADRMFR